MTESFEHNCIKCSVKYQDDDEDAYYCPACLEEKKAIAEKLDKELGSTVGQQPQSDLTRFNELQKKARKGFVNINDLNNL